ncbi:hypothetical protein DKT77_11395 [Meridianimarinicoccus roseus]|uniref:Methyltransferase FkbM domain-containing protein n=1 Tax=Meridianimarinicoccus roseus TaxID=2072018 RepID=A0A2V2LL55_9RHOB|nr:FkbM family methyltransferase [Meridianimarinicoccus roseus]PWR02523.1 hypothetical protein DKT77_11395 [Meridianimarinicoccus roseus]
MLERSQVIDAYRLLLGREPESDAVIEQRQGMASLDELGAVLVASAEFRRRASLGTLPTTAQRWVCAEIRGGLRLWIDLMDLGVGAGALRDNWEQEETDFLLGTMNRGDHFVDIGANIGWFTVLGAQRVGPDGHVTAFEPRPDLFRRLRDSLAANDLLGRCALHNIALGREPAEMEIAASPDESNPGHSYLVSGAVDSGAVSLGKVPVRRLDDIGIERPVTLLKIDIEGAEAMALEGARGLLARDKPVILSEFFPQWLRRVSGVEPAAYLSLLRDIGYTVYELAQDGPGALITDLPQDSEKEGFFTNIVALPEGRQVAVRAPGDPDRAIQLPGPVTDGGQAAMWSGIDSLARRLGTLETQMTTRDAVSRLSDEVRQINVRQRERADQIEAEAGTLHAMLAGKLHKLEAELQQMIAMQASMASLESDIRRIARRKPPLKRLMHELKKPFTRAFWEREKAKLLGHASRNNADVPESTAAAPEIPVDWNAIRAARAGCPALAGVDRPVAMIVDDRLPEPDSDSGSLDAVNLVSSLVACGYHVVFGVASDRPQLPQYLDGLRKLGARALAEQDAPSVQGFIERHGSHVDLFVLSRVSAGGQFLELIRHNAPDAKIIFNTVDLHHVREARAARMANDDAALEHAERTRDREEFLVDQADLTFVVSTVENEILQAALPGCATAVLPLARKIRRPDTGFADRSGVGFIGGFEHAPNIDAMRYFLGEVWPLVHARDPSIPMGIVGASLPDEVLEGVPGDVRYLGSLPDIDDWFDGLRMSVAPLRIGAGAKGKVASSLTNGLPCVLSSVAAEGMDLENGRHVLIGDTPADLAEHIVTLNGDPDLWKTLSENGLEFAQNRLSVAHFASVVRASLIRMELPAD